MIWLRWHPFLYGWPRFRCCSGRKHFSKLVKDSGPFQLCMPDPVDTAHLLDLPLDDSDDNWLTLTPNRVVGNLYNNNSLKLLFFWFAFSSLESEVVGRICGHNSIKVDLLAIKQIFYQKKRKSLGGLLNVFRLSLSVIYPF